MVQQDYAQEIFDYEHIVYAVLLRFRQYTLIFTAFFVK